MLLECHLVEISDVHIGPFSRLVDGLVVGDQVYRRNSGEDWRVGFVTDLIPLKVTEKRDPFDEGFVWDEVQPMFPCVQSNKMSDKEMRWVLFSMERASDEQRRFVKDRIEDYLKGFFGSR